MEPQIKILPRKMLVGLSARMSLVEDRTAELWRTFKPHVKRIANRAGPDFFSMQRYDAAVSPNTFRPDMVFEKWAAVEVQDLDNVPDSLESTVMEGGTYAVFIHAGIAKEFPKTWQFISSDWMPRSGYMFDHREHFEVFGPEYRPDDPNAREFIWVPVKQKE